jgi:hypothetical protein
LNSNIISIIKHIIRRNVANIIMVPIVTSLEYAFSC